MKEKNKSVSCQGLTAEEILNWVKSILEENLEYTGVAYQDAILILPKKKSS